MKDALLVPVSSFIVISMITDLSPSNRAAALPALVVYGFLLNFGSLATCISFGESLQPVAALLPLTVPATDKHSCWGPDCPPTFHSLLLPFIDTAVHVSGEKYLYQLHNKQHLLLLAKAPQQKPWTLKCQYKLYGTFKIQLFIKFAQIAGEKTVIRKVSTILQKQPFS